MPYGIFVTLRLFQKSRWYSKIIIIGNLQSALASSKRFTALKNTCNAQMPIMIQIIGIQEYRTYEN